MQSPPLVHVIILNWNHLEDLKLTLDSFLAQDYSNLKIIVADNGSTDGSIEYIKRQNKNIELIENGENLGYAAGNNTAIKWSLNQNADCILLANNDILIEDRQLISKIIARLFDCNNNNIGIYGIQERNYYFPDKIESEGHFLFEDFSTPAKQFNIIRSNNKEVLPYPIKSVDFVPGSYIMISREVFEKCGLLDEAFFIYHEEAEFCFRAWNNGFNVVIDPSFFYFHKVARSAGTNSPSSLYYRIRNNFYFLKKHKKTIQFYSYYKTRYTISIGISLFRNIILLPFRFSKKRLKFLKSIIWAIIDVSNHKYGFRNIQN